MSRVSLLHAVLKWDFRTDSMISLFLIWYHRYFYDIIPTYDIMVGVMISLPTYDIIILDMISCIFLWYHNSLWYHSWCYDITTNIWYHSFKYDIMVFSMISYTYDIIGILWYHMQNYDIIGKPMISHQT